MEGISLIAPAKTYNPGLNYRYCNCTGYYHVCPQILYFALSGKRTCFRPALTPLLSRARQKKNSEKKNVCKQTI